MAREILERDLDCAGMAVTNPRPATLPDDVICLRDLTAYGSTTFTDGLTKDLAGVVHGDYITGKAGGQTWTSGTAVADGLVIKTTSAVSPTGTLQLIAGTTRIDGALRVNLTDDPSGAIPSWDGRHAVIGVGATSASPGFGFSYSTTINSGQGILSVLAPGVAWRSFRLQATQFDYYANGTVNTFSVLGATAVTAQVNANALLLVAPTARITGSPTLLRVTGAAHTSLTASNEAIDVYLNLARTVQFATGALATQRAVVFEAPTYSFVGASTITTAATLVVTGAPIVGTNATITQTLALWVQSGASRIDGTLRVNVGADSSPGTIISWDGRYSAVTVGALLNSPGLGISYSTATSQAIVSAVEPGIAFRGLRLQAIGLDYWANGTLNTFSILGTTVATAIVQVNGVVRANMVSDSTPGTITTWDSRYSVFGVGATSTSPGLGISYSITTGAVLTSAEPGVAWKGIRLQASQLDYYANGSLNTFSLSGITSATSLAQVNGALRVNLTNDTTGSVPTWDGRHSVFGVGATSSSPGFGFSYSTTINSGQGILSVLEPGVAWRSFRLQASQFDYYASSLFNTFSIAGNLATNASVDVKALLTVVPTARTTGSPNLVSVTGPAHTNLTASIEAIDVAFNLARTVQFGTGALATQRAVLIQAPTYSFVAASPITTAATLAITGAPIVGTNCTGITNAYALWVESGTAWFAGSVAVAMSAGSFRISAITGLLKATVGFVGLATSGADYEAGLAFSTGLTRVTNTITANLSTGVSGGQTMYGGTTTGDLTIKSNTSSGGKILLSSANNGFNESTGNFYLGTSSPISTALFHMTRTSNALTEMIITNPNTGTAAGATCRVGIDTVDTSFYLGMTMLGTGFTTSGLLSAQVGLIEYLPSNSASLVFSHLGTGDMVWATTGSRVERARLTNGGLFGIGITPLSTAKLHVDQSQNGFTEAFVTNANGGANAAASLMVGLNPASDSGSTLQMTMLGTGFTTSGVLSPRAGFINHRPGNGAPLIFSADGAGDMIWTTTSSYTERVRLYNRGEWLYTLGGTQITTGGDRAMYDLKSPATTLVSNGVAGGVWSTVGIRTAPVYAAASGSASATTLASLYIDAPPNTSTGFSATNFYSLFVDFGLGRFDGAPLTDPVFGGFVNTVWEVPSFSPDIGLSGTTLLIPVKVTGVGLRYLELVSRVS